MPTPEDVTVTIKMTCRRRWVPDFLSMLEHMQYLGNIGSSREVAIYSDGDGDFRPKFDFLDFDGDFEAVKPRRVSPNGDVMFDAG